MTSCNPFPQSCYPPILQSSHPAMVDGLIIIDKPAGPSSHDVVARMRRVLGERRIGHTGTLDPLATGVLPLVVGRATRLARFMSASDKAYEAVVRLGVSTDTADKEGTAIGSAFTGTLPSREEIDRALDAFRGTFQQQPPAFSAKKIAGQRSYRMARRARQLFSTGAGAPPPARAFADAAPLGAAWPQALPVTDAKSPAPASVTVYRLDLVRVDNAHVTLAVDCSAGFYVRSLAHDLGQALGTGAHLEALRRTRSGGFTLSAAMPLAEAEQDRDRARAAVVPLAGMLPELPAVVLTVEGVRHAVHGRELGAGDIDRDLGLGIWDLGCHVRLLDRAGGLVGIARPSKAAGSLHPFVVLM
jgi:tRNA pseudouridine55 synthase